MKLWVNVCFYYVGNRLDNFKRTIENILKIPNVHLVIDSNVNFDPSLNIRVTQLDDPFHHTWEHKKSMVEFLESDYTHFAYIEGNLEVDKRIFNYWCKTRELFKRNHLNFIPATHRIQKDNNGVVYTLDCTHKVHHPVIVEVEGQKFVSLTEPYQGMFIMDRELVKEHIESDYFKLGEKGWWGIRESANLGNMYVNIPSGYNHRCLVPMDNFSECWTLHFGTDYHNDKYSPHAKVKIEDLF